MSTVTLANFIMIAARVLHFMILASIVISFLPRVDRSHPIVRFIEQVTEPLFAPFRQILPSGRMGLDFSPLFAMFSINILARVLVSVLVG
jgi:YggT family protein